MLQKQFENETRNPKHRLKYNTELTCLALSAHYSAEILHLLLQNQSHSQCIRHILADTFLQQKYVICILFKTSAAQW